MVAMVILGGAWGHHDNATDFGGDTSRTDDGVTAAVVCGGSCRDWFSGILGCKYGASGAPASVKGLLLCREAFVVLCAFAIGPAEQSKPGPMVLQPCGVAVDQAM